KNPRPLRIIIAAIAVLLLAAVILFVVFHNNDNAEGGNIFTDTDNQTVAETIDSVWFCNADNSRPSEIAVSDTIIDSMQLYILTPYNATPELFVGRLDTTDNSILLAAQAADLSRDKGKIVGAFVCAGEPLSWGLSKKGYCAIFGDSVTVGMADNSPLFEQATDVGGYFFRQYPAVSEGKMVENKPENRSYRRALCTLNGKSCVVYTTDRVMMNDFSTALVKLGVRDAIFLVGSTSHGWYRQASDNSVVQLGYPGAPKMKYINYLVFRRQ
ncbi:MAG: hypothetical protein IKX51_02285, partial [Bacteroidales bacterium]|nr:hypothetical protein [Bacteroidales bacterium]